MTTNSFQSLPQTEQSSLKELVLEIVRDRGRVCLSDLSGYVRTACFVKFGYEFDYSAFVSNCHAAIWDLQKTHLIIEKTRFDSQAVAYEPDF